MEGIQHYTGVRAVGMAHQTGCRLQILHSGPGNEFQIHILPIISCQFTQAGKGIFIKAGILTPNIGQDFPYAKLGGSLQILFIITDVYTIKNSGIFCIMKADTFFFRTNEYCGLKLCRLLSAIKIQHNGFFLTFRRGIN